ncbi:MAG: PorT family protein [Tannerellaceae bacterium]|jgi:hypothetical protein|nr:PorT family protein [Tannerellaceae bacterium]
MMNNKLLLILALLGACIRSDAQVEDGKKWEYKMFAGYNIGGSSPIPLPAEIRGVNSWSPAAFGGAVGLHVTRFVTPQWGITSGLAIDIKGMTIEADVKYMNTSLVVGEGDHRGVFSGMFTGENKTKVRNGYLVLPLLATYSATGRWRLHAGGYVAFLRDAMFEGHASNGYIRNGGPAGDRIKIEESAFDFSEHTSKTDAGLMAAADWRFMGRLALTGQLSWGLTPFFPSGFDGIPYKMYNIYMMAGIACRL